MFLTNSSRGPGSEGVDALRKRAHTLSVTVRIGKAGVTRGIIDEIIAQLRKQGMVKIRMLRSYKELYADDDAIERIAEESSAKILTSTGNTVVLYRD